MRLGKTANPVSLSKGFGGVHDVTQKPEAHFSLLKRKRETVLQELSPGKLRGGPKWSPKGPEGEIESPYIFLPFILSSEWLLC